MNEDYEQEDYDSFEEDARIMNIALPAVVREFEKSALEVSHGNGIPASISYFVILGQLCKDFIRIPNGRNIEDSRIHFCWVQTSGTGKSTLWTFVGNVANKAFQRVNAMQGHPSLRKDNIVIPRKFDTFSVTDYTDSVLIGKYVKDEDDDDEWRRRPGILEGSGLAHWDEFEYSGVFKQSTHKEQSIVYLNTLMNSLAGEAWVISKALDSMDGKTMHCYCERSVLAMTYPPNNLNTVMAEKGVLQRMLLYVREVPQYEQDRMRLEQLDLAGKIADVKSPIDQFANSLASIYKVVKDRYEEVGRNPLETMTYTEDFRQAIKLEYHRMNIALQNTRPDVAKICSNFTTRLMKILIKLSVLCSVASAPSISNKEDRFIVTSSNVMQASSIVQQCYKTLVMWLEQSLKVKRQSIAENSLEPLFISTYGKIKKDENGFVNKNLFLTEVRKRAKKSRSQIYRYYDIIRHKFEELKEGRSTYIKLIMRGEDE
ncbi:MAG: hypothetical protein CM15mV62_240 [uncultured marine virus]|nr:MAG: hypothetical protein CM15mV62_240 [uncultured marine virus]